MKTITTLFTILIVLLLLQSCNQDDMEVPQKHKSAKDEIEYNNSMKQRDSTSNNCETDPPKLPTPPIKL